MSETQVKPRSPYKTRVSNVTILTAPFRNDQLRDCDVLLCSATRKQLIETEPEHASRTQLAVSKSPVVT